MFKGSEGSGEVKGSWVWVSHGRLERKQNKVMGVHAHFGELTAGKGKGVRGVLRAIRRNRGGWFGFGSNGNPIRASGGTLEMNQERGRSFVIVEGEGFELRFRIGRMGGARRA